MILLFWYWISNWDFETTPIDLNTWTLGNLGDFTWWLWDDPIDLTWWDISSWFTWSVDFTSTNDYWLNCKKCVAEMIKFSHIREIKLV